MKNPIKSIIHIYKEMTNFGKVLLFISLFLILVIFFKTVQLEIKNREKKEGFELGKENFEQNEKFLFKKGPDIYDNFYSNIYDLLVFNNLKDDYEITSIINKTNPSSQSIILDVGSGTGHHVAKLSNHDFNTIGIDISPAMIKQSKENYPNNKFILGDVLDSTKFKLNSFTHILCLYFTIYYLDNKQTFFDNCMDWLMPGGYLIIHLVDREKFDPILPPGNPLYIVSPQKYAKERITKTKIKFNEFDYNSNFELDKDNNKATFHEKFKFDNGKVRKQEQILYMENTQDIISMAQDTGFIIHGKIDLMECAYEHQYLYIFVKPS